MYGAELTDEEQDVTLENFVDLIDDQSWEEFMPRGVTKELFKEFIPYYDPDMFRAVGRSYRDLVRSADKLPPMERTREIARIFSYFRNPDKETVLTPWRVVNMHIGDCIGGQVFFDEDKTTELPKPRYVSHGEVTENVFKDKNTRILELNSKTGLYPLYMTYSVFAEKLKEYRDSHKLATDVPLDVQNQIWDEVLRNNIFVICKTEMAKSITKRTLRGFRSAKVNARYFENLINKITNQTQLFIKHAVNGKQYWKNPELEDNMKFNAIVGNPPYQVVKATDKAGANSSFATAIYPAFISIAQALNPLYISMITPSRWMTKTGQGVNEDWADRIIRSNHFLSLIDYYDASEVFSGIEIKGGVSYFLYSDAYTGKCHYSIHQSSKTSSYYDYLNFEGAGVVIRDEKAISILRKVISVEGRYFDANNFSSFVGPQHFFDKDGLLTTSWRGYSNKQDKEYCIKYYLNKNLTTDGFAWIKPVDIPKGNKSIPIHKIYISKAYGAGDNFPHQILGIPFYGEPQSVCSQTYLIIGYDPIEHNLSKEECENIISYIKTRFFRYLVSIKKKTQDNPSSVFQFVPTQDWSESWTDTELYKKYNLTKEEIDYIESMIKPMGDDNALFDKDDYIDPEFATFSLEEHGVKIGDVIVYTPTNTELVVAEDNKVKCGEDIFTLAEFTAKFMPRNKRSVSGVCQGPKYFTYNGMTLYTLKESFGK